MPALACHVCGCRRECPCIVDLGDRGDGATCARWQDDEGRWVCSVCAGQARRLYERGEVLY